MELEAAWERRRQREEQEAGQEAEIAKELGAAAAPDEKRAGRARDIVEMLS